LAVDSIRKQRGGTLLGLVIGVVVGLAVALAAAIYITHAPLPFVTKVQRPSVHVNPAASGAPLPDPNKPMYSAAKSQATPTAPTAAAPAVPLPQPAPAKEAAADDAGTRFLLQVGAFRSPGEADTMRARLALLGLDARIFPIDQGGETLFRVRLGPYGQLEEINRTRKLLAENNIDAQVVRLK
jgi:cell division protein FtsN